MGNSPTKSTTNNAPWAPAQPALKDILGKAQTLSNNIGLFTPTFGANTTQGLNSLGQLGASPSAAATAASPIAGQAAGNYATGANTLGQIAGGQMNPFINDYLSKANQLTADSVNNQFSAAGRYGSGAQTTALTNAIGLQNLGALTGQFNQDQANRLSAGSTLANQGIAGAQLGQQVDAGRAGQLGLQVAAGQQQDQNALAAKQAPLNAAAYEAGLVNPIGQQGGTQKSTQTQGSNPLTTGLGLGVSALSLLSDERLKENIQQVGKTNDGQKIYSYNYKGDPRPTLGLLAQEVEQNHPEAVGSVGGMKTVNYKAATKGAAKGPIKNKTSLGKLAG
jgi:hypothetical protein